MVQTFSKSRQRAGARRGLAMGNAKLIADLNRVKFSPFSYTHLDVYKRQLEDLLTQGGFEGDALDNALASVER